MLSSGRRLGRRQMRFDSFGFCCSAWWSAGCTSSSPTARSSELLLLRLLGLALSLAAVTHWDYRSDPSFGDEDFNNATHLHAASAVRFTEGLAGRLSAGGCGP